MSRLIKKLQTKLDIARSGLRLRQNEVDELLGELFQDPELRQTYPDYMAFVDLVPAAKVKRIIKDYRNLRHRPNFNRARFVQEHLKGYVIDPKSYVSDPEHSIEQHIEALWQVLRRDTPKSVGSLIGLPKPYVVAGGRFTAQFYWDTYFTMLGLAASGHWDMVENMLRNCAYLIQKLGFVPNGSRTYLATRSQPPVFALMVRLLATKKGKEVLGHYLAPMLLEHDFWMQDTRRLRSQVAVRRVVRMPDGEVLNRYFDNKNTPRPEGYKEDTAIAMAVPAESRSKMYVDLRAAAESGWDFSSRWLRDPHNLATLHTTDIVPVDLNCLLYMLEQTIAKAYKQRGKTKRAATYRQLAAARGAAINKYCWDDAKGFYFDFDIVAGERTSVVSAAGLFPLYAGISTVGQAKAVVVTTRHKLLKPGGLLTTPQVTGQQWDAPNGWAPLQWVAVRALRAYGRDTLAGDIKRRWIATVTKVYRVEAKLVEKYNVLDPTQPAGGGEYLLQDGFGWTNGVLLALLHENEVHWEGEPTSFNHRS